MDRDVDRRVKYFKLTAQRRQTHSNRRCLFVFVEQSDCHDQMNGFTVMPGWTMSEHTSCRYGSASSCNAWYVITPILNCIRCSTGSQCRSLRRICIMCSHLETPPNSLTAAFLTDCSRQMSRARRPTSNELQ